MATIPTHVLRREPFLDIRTEVPFLIIGACMMAAVITASLLLSAS